MHDDFTRYSPELGARLAQHSGCLWASSFRPAGILPRQSARLLQWLLAPITVRVDQLAEAMIDELLRDPERRYRVVSNQELRRSA